MTITFIYPQYLWLLLLIPITIGLSLVAWRTVSGRLIRSTRRWGSLVLRVILLLLIVFALSGIQLRLHSASLTTVFVLDVSDSISSSEQSKGETIMRQAIESMPSGDRAAIVIFGEDALVERLATEERNIAELTSIPITTRTDIASALQLAQAIFPDEGAKRLILLSDGRENLEKALEQAELASTNRTELLFVPLGEPQGEIEVLIDALVAPADVRQGQDIALTVNLHSTAQVGATLRIFYDGSLIETRGVRLQTGDNRLEVQVSASLLGKDLARTGGFHRFRAQIIPDADTRLQNNEASAFTVVHGPPRVLVVEGKPGESDNLINALTAAEMQVSQITPSEMPTTLPELAGFESIVFVNVSVSSIPPGVMDVLPVYVRELGMGLVVVGGTDAYGAGGYLRTPLEEALPVSMDVKDKEMQANLALVLAVDKSGSMGRCHCDNPDLNQTYTRAEVGQPKVDIAKEAIMRAASALGSQDYLGVVTFDSSAHWALHLNRWVDPLLLERAIGTFKAEGNTNLYAGVQAAYEALQGVTARRKHIILMTDGWVRQGDLTGLALRMKDNGVTLSVVAAGQGSAEYLASLAQIGGGTYYPARDILGVPDIFLKETVKSVGRYIIEEPFYPLPVIPGPIFQGLNVTNLPPLLGYNGSTPKNTARLDLITSRGDPLLATWQFGLGRSAAWTSDLKGQWAKDWIAWEGFSRFAAQLVGWTLPMPNVEGLTVKAEVENGRASVRLDALDKGGRPLNYLSGKATIVDPDLQTIELNLKQVGPGQYEGIVDIPKPGTYLVRLGVNQGDQSLGQLTLGMVEPYSPEYKANGIDRGFLSELARITGGSELKVPSAAFLHNLPAVDYAREVWRPLLLLVALLFPVDVALRRMMLGLGDIREARAWIIDRLRSQRVRVLGQPRLLNQLFKARDRARLRQSIHARQDDDKEKYTNSTDTVVNKPRQSSLELPLQTPVPGELGQSDSLSRLREAKKRARRQG